LLDQSTDQKDQDMHRKLIVNADDYGRTSLVSAGIRSAHMKGIVSSTTAMMNFPGIEEDLDAAMQECPQLGLGVHLNLTAGEPISPKEKVRSLLDDNGNFPSAKGFPGVFPSINLEEVQLEWETQIQKFVRLTGNAPDHLDSHHHISYLSAELFNLMLELADNQQCAIRRPTAESRKILPQDLLIEMGEQAENFIPDLISRHSPKMPDWFLSSFFDQYATLEHLVKMLENLQEGVSELMCHPGFKDDELEKCSSYAKQRDKERQIMEDAVVRNLLTNLEVELIRFGDI
jgi:chitin disaccharide deacetylase